MVVLKLQPRIRQFRASRGWPVGSVASTTPSTAPTTMRFALHRLPSSGLSGHLTPPTQHSLAVVKATSRRPLTLHDSVHVFFVVRPMPQPHTKRPRASGPSGAPPLKNVVTPMVVYGLWTQKQTAAYLNVCERYLRDSSCPKVLLPGNGKKQKESVIRYAPEAVLRWTANWSTEKEGALHLKAV